MFRGDKSAVYHVCRHTAATTLVNDLAVPTVIVADILGHASLSTTQRYVTQSLTRCLISLAACNSGLPLAQFRVAFGRPGGLFVPPALWLPEQLCILQPQPAVVILIAYRAASRIALDSGERPGPAMTR